MRTNEGEDIQAKYQVAPVTKPLTSVAKVCDQGQLVLFHQHGGYIVDPNSNRVTEFERARDVYTLDTWMWTGDLAASKPPGFARQEM